LIEGLALITPRLSVATIARRAAKVAAARGWRAPAYSTVHEVVTRLDPQLLTLAHDGPEAFRDRYELVYRRQAERPNEIWQPTTPNWTSWSWTPTAVWNSRG
jgi:putative transposase